MAATARHWKHAMAGLLKGRPSSDTGRHQHDEAVSIWSTIATPLFANLPKLPAIHIHTEPPEVEAPYDLNRLFRSQDIVYNPDSQQMVIAILSFMTNKPHMPLPPEYNSHLLHILESYSSILEALNEEQRDHEIDTLAMEDTLRQWEKDRKEFKAEIKRLEEHIARQEGMEAMFIARTKSILRKRDYETAENAIGRIRRGGAVKQSQRSNKKLLHQPSVRGPSCVSIRPGKDYGAGILVGKPRDSEGDTSLSRFLESPLEFPNIEEPTQKRDLPEAWDHSEVEDSFSAELEGIERLIPTHGVPSSFPSKNSSVVTVINTKKGNQREEPVGTAYGTSYSSQVRGRPIVVSEQTFHSRNFSFVPGDDSRIPLRDPGPSSQAYIHINASGSRPEISSVASGVGRYPEVRFLGSVVTEAREHSNEPRGPSQPEIRHLSPEMRPKVKGRTKSEGSQTWDEHDSKHLGLDSSTVTKSTRRARATSALGAFTQMAGVLVTKKKENKDSPQKAKGAKNHFKDDVTKGEKGDVRTADEISRCLRF